MPRRCSHSSHLSAPMGHLPLGRGGFYPTIRVKGARENNLKNISVEIPKKQIVVITGLSGSGKSSLAFDVIYAEGQRRYLEGVSSYARQFLDIGAKAEVDQIENLSPTIAIDQKSLRPSPRSTVGTITEIYEYLRVLFSKVGTVHCPNCRIPMKKTSCQEVLKNILKLPDGTRISILAKIGKDGQNIKEILKTAKLLNFARVRIGGAIKILEEAMSSVEEISSKEEVCVVVDRLSLNKKSPDKERILDSIETAFKLSQGFLVVSADGQDSLYNKDFICPKCYFEIKEVSPKNFSFNNPEGACPHCCGLGAVKEVSEELIAPNGNISLAEGAILPLSRMGGKSNGAGNYLEILAELGEKNGFSINDPLKKLTPRQWQIIFYGTGEKGEFSGVVPMIKKKYEDSASLLSRNELEKYMSEKICPVCQGKRLQKAYLSVLVLDRSIDDVTRLDIDHFLDFLEELEKARFNLYSREIIAPMVKEMRVRAEALKNVGLNYLALNRGADSISGGEGQRIRLSAQISSDLSDVIYVLDEPTAGLHSRDTKKLIATLEKLKEAGNSLIIVEHDRDMIEKADWVIDMGPGAGESGGEIIFSGERKKMARAKTSTAKFLAGENQVAPKRKVRSGSGKYLEILGAQEHNLKNINVKIPLERLVAVTGVSGSGKSSLINDVLAKALSRHFFRAKDTPGLYREIKGLSCIDKVIDISQASIGRTPRSNAATYTGVFNLIRELFTQTEEAKKMNYEASRFSFNMRGGRCENCQGEGMKKIEMYLMPDVYVECESCQGTRYNQKTLAIEYRGVNIAHVLDMSVSYALKFFKDSPLIVDKLKTLEEVGLGYLKLGQSATTLSGGEAQRIKLATELARHSTGKTLYTLDEPTTGLHFEDVKKLLQVLNALVNKGNTVLVVEHNLDIIRSADWVIDLGPEGGDKGGEVIYAGVPEGLKKCQRGWTRKYL